MVENGRDYALVMDASCFQIPKMDVIFLANLDAEAR